jgi:hypothetical protein
VQIGTGWDDDGTPLLELNKKWVRASEVIVDLENYLRFADKLDVARENEMADFMTAEPEEKVPMAFAGKAHELMVVNRLRPVMEVHVLTPSAATHLDNSRRTLPVNDPNCSILKIDMVTNMLRTARKSPTAQP